LQKHDYFALDLFQASWTCGWADTKAFRKWQTQSKVLCKYWL